MANKPTQREITQKWIEQYQSELNTLEGRKPSTVAEERLWQAQCSALKSQIEDLERQLENLTSK